MTEWLGPIRDAAGMGLTWAAGWALAGVAMGMTTGFLPDGHPMRTFVDPWVALATPGFIGGVAYSAVLRIAEGPRRFVEMSLLRAGAWGAVTDLLLGVLPLTVGTPTAEHPLWLPGVTVIGAATLLSAVSACGSLTFARSVADARRNG